MSSFDFALYYPLIALGLIYTVLSVAGRIVEGRGRPDVGETLQTLGFGAILLAAPYTVVLLVMSLISYPIRLSDMAIIFAIIFVFFGVLLGLLLVLAEVRVGGRPVGAYVGTLAGAAFAVFIALSIF
ncbi:MAG: hypothetical protein M3481_04700 [Actinomycetota bacterium]|nr:hypothetical protein [Actinomycetota bacterium]